METKKSIRQIIRKQRKELDPMIWQSQTAEICRKTCELDIFREATDIYCYIDFGGEVGTRPLMLEAWKLGKTVWVPKVHGETMDFYEITSFDELKPGAYGILEPDAGIPASADDGLMIMPGVAFDTNPIVSAMEAVIMTDIWSHILSFIHWHWLLICKSYLKSRQRNKILSHSFL